MSLSGLTVPAASESEARASWAAHHERIANEIDMQADNLPPGDPSIEPRRAEAGMHRAKARLYRGER